MEVKSIFNRVKHCEENQCNCREVFELDPL